MLIQGMHKHEACIHGPLTPEEMARIAQLFSSRYARTSATEVVLGEPGDGQPREEKQNEEKQNESLAELAASSQAATGQVTSSKESQRHKAASGDVFLKRTGKPGYALY